MRCAGLFRLSLCLGRAKRSLYLITSDAVYQARCREDALAAQQGPFSALFNNCHAVMSEVREIEQNRAEE